MTILREFEVGGLNLDSKVKLVDLLMLQFG